MNPFIEQFINQKLKSMTVDELIKYGEMYNISFSTNEAAKLIEILKSEKNISITNDEQHKQIIKKIGKEINPTIAKKANELLKQFKHM